MAKLTYFYVVGSFASLSTVLLAAEAEAGTFSSMAERWGLWAALTLVLIGAMMWALYKIVNFVLTTLVELIERVEHTLAKVSETIQHAPCGEGWTDSDTQDKRPGRQGVKHGEDHRR